MVQSNEPFAMSIKRGKMLGVQENENDAENEHEEERGESDM